MKTTLLRRFLQGRDLFSACLWQVVLVLSSTAIVAVNSPAAGDVDCSFLCGNAIYDSIDSWVDCMAVQPDGRILIGGTFSKVHGVGRGGIARLNPDGTLDGGFLNGLAGAERFVSSVAVQSDGKVLIGGFFTKVNTVSRNRMARLNADGTLDTSFLNGLAGADWEVRSMAVQSDGKVLIGGGFSTVNGVARRSLARLNVDGTLDTSFENSVLGPNTVILQITLQSDEKVLIAGYNVFARLNSDGTRDISFMNLAIDGTVYSVAMQSDGKILIGGAFKSVSGLTRNGIARLNADGSLDRGFLDSLPEKNAAVDAIAVRSDGKILVAGGHMIDAIHFESVFARLNPDGNVDSGFQARVPGAGWFKAITLQGDGKILVSGSRPNTPVNQPFFARLWGEAVQPPTITVQPQSQTACLGDTVVFPVTATGAVPLNYQWRRGESNIPNATSATLSLSNVQANSAGDFTVLVSNSGGSVTSQVARFMISLPPLIMQQPQSQAVRSGANVSFEAIAGGAAPLAYQWLKDGQNLPGAIGPVLALTNVQANDAGKYVVEIRNACGRTNSQSAALTVEIGAGIGRTIRAAGASGRVGGDVTVPVELTAQGDENTVAFSLEFDSKSLSYVDAAMSALPTGTTFVLNTNRVLEGRLGVLVALPVSQNFSAKTHELLRVSFRTTVNPDRNIVVKFADVPVVREVVSSDVQVLTTQFVPGMVSISDSGSGTDFLRQSEIIWQHDDGWIAGWSMEGLAQTGAGYFNPKISGDRQWRIVSSADLNGDKHQDLLWEHNDGTIAAWFMKGRDLASSALFSPSRPAQPGWHLAGAGDFNTDGKHDLAWQHEDGTIAIWHLDGINLTQAALVSPPHPGDPKWRVAGIADLNRDSNPDLVWQHSDGPIAAWLMQGSQLSKAEWFNPDRPDERNWRLAQIRDFNGDQNPDLVWQHTDGRVAVWFMQGLKLIGGGLTIPSHPGDVAWRIARPFVLEPDPEVIETKSQVIIAAQGGTIALPKNGSSILIPRGTFTANSAVALSLVALSPGTQEIYSETTKIFDAGPSADQLVVITTSAIPFGDEMTLTMKVPEGFLDNVGGHYSPQVFVQAYSRSDEAVFDSFELIPSEFNSQAKTWTIRVPAWGFTSLRGSPGGYECAILVGSLPNEPGSVRPRALTSTAPENARLSQNSGCLSELYSPIQGLTQAYYTKTISSEVGERPDPENVTELQHHAGIDSSLKKYREAGLGTSEPTPTVVAAADGWIKWIGWVHQLGQVVIVQHQGFQTLYAHLVPASIPIQRPYPKTSETNFDPLDRIFPSRGKNRWQSYGPNELPVVGGVTPLGKLGNSGRRSQGAHLHFEYTMADIMELIQRKTRTGRLNPLPCVVKNPPSSVIIVSPSTLSFSTAERLFSKKITITNTNISPFNYSITDGTFWLSESPVSGLVKPGESVSIEAAVNVSGLASGVYRDAILITEAGMGSPQAQVPVTLNITEPETYSLEITKTGDGSGTVLVSPPGTKFAKGTPVTLTASSDGGSVFANWSGECSGNVPSCILVMNSNKQAGARFDKRIVPLLPSISIADVAVTEGNAGTVNANFQVTLSALSLTNVTANYTTAGGSASSGSDYLASSGKLTIPAGVLSKVITVAVNGDALVEPDETFFVNLSEPVNAILSKARGTGTIRNDDQPPADDKPSVTISTMECRFDSQKEVFRVPGGSGIDRSYTVIASGMVTAPVGAEFSVYTNPAWAGSEQIQFAVSGWTRADPWNYRRDPGNPSTASWTYSSSGFTVFTPDGQPRAQSEVTLTARVRSLASNSKTAVAK